MISCSAVYTPHDRRRTVMRKLIIILAVLFGMPAPAFAQVETLVSVNGWRAYSATSSSGRQLCGMGTSARRTGRFFWIKAQRLSGNMRRLRPDRRPRLVGPAQRARAHRGRRSTSRRAELQLHRHATADHDRGVLPWRLRQFPGLRARIRRWATAWRSASPAAASAPGAPICGGTERVTQAVSQLHRRRL